MASEPGTYPATQQKSMDQEAGRVDLIAALLVALVVAGGTINAGPLVLSDPDTLWQLRVGSDIWKTFSLPVQDTYSFTFSGQKWIAEQWLAQLILSAFYAIGGWRGVVVLVGLSVGLTAFLFCREIGRATNPRIAAIITLIALFLTSSIFNARPHILVLPIAVAWTAALFRAAERRQSPPFIYLALLIAWINLHGSFSIAILVAAFAFCHVIEIHGLGDRPLLLRWVGFLACCLVAMGVHPYGVEPLLFAVRLARGNDWIPSIVEWLPFNAKDAPFHEAGLLAFFAILLWLRPKLSLSKIAFVVFALHMFLLHKRFVFAFTLLVPMVIIRDVVMQDFRLSRTAWAGRSRDYLERLIAERFRVALAGLAAAAIIVPFLFLRNALEPPSEVFAGKAIRFAQENLLPARVLNDYDFGGTLIFHGIPTFVDGRSGMLFLGKFAADFEESVRPDGAGTFVRQLEEYKIGWTLLRNIDPRNLVLATLPQWQRVYSDDDVKIYKRVAEAASNAQLTDCLPGNQVSDGDGKNSECLR
jgi:hypothetical protein